MFLFTIAFLLCLSETLAYTPIFSQHFIDLLARKPYIRGKKTYFDTTRVNILGVNLTDAQVYTFFENCDAPHLVYGENMKREIFTCGQVSVMNLKDINASSPEGNEELDIVLSGEREWGKSMLPLSWHNLRNMAGYYYNTDWYAFKNAPHGILVNGPVPSNIERKLGTFEHATPKGVHTLKSKVKTLLTMRHITAYEEKIKEDAFQKGRNFQAGVDKMDADLHQRERVTVVERREVPVVVQDTRSAVGKQSCKENLRSVLGALDQCNAAKNDSYRDGYNKGHADGMDEGFARGVNEAQSAGFD